MYLYTVYGLEIQSVIPLPELVVGQTGKDVTIRFGKLDCSPLKGIDAEYCFCFQATAEDAYFFWKDVGTFLVQYGREIIVDPLPGAKEQGHRLFILGTGLATLLHQRGLLILHSSAVAVNGKAVAFLGGSGWGKSTMAAALHGRGHRLLADDVVALEVGSMENPIMFPSFPQLKLWPEVATSLGHELETLSLLYPRFKKRGHRVTSGFSPAPLPLKRIYVLAEGTFPKIESLCHQESFVDILRHSYFAPSALLLQGTRILSHLHQCTKLASCVSICRLTRPSCLSTLSNIAKLVEEDIA